MKTNKKIFIFFVILSVLCLISVFFLFPVTHESVKACIYVDGKLYESFILSGSTSEKEIYIETQYGYNKLLIKDGKIGVLEADCPDKTCVNTGMTDNSSRPVICMPHRLEIIIVDSVQIDGVTG